MEDIRKGACPLCLHNEIIEGPVFDLSPTRDPQTGALDGQGAFPAGFSYTGGSARGAIVVHGPLTRYACRKCGYTQTFAGTPMEIPIGPKHGTRILSGAAPSGAYR